MKAELAHEIENDIALQENILKEIIENWEEWQKDEYEREFMLLDQNQEYVFCPMCEFNFLQLNENIISCVCGLRSDFNNVIEVVS